jgi:transposase
MKMPSLKQYDMSNYVMTGKGSMRDCASLFGVTRSTVQRAMDAVTEFENQKFSLELTGAELKQVLGWLRNGNWTACDLADSIEERI